MISKHHALSSGTAEEYFLKGREYHEAGDFIKAKREYLESLKLAPSFADALFNMGIISHKEGDIDRAIEWYEKGLRHAPKNALAHANLGKLYEEKGFFNKALQAGETAVTLDPALIHDIERRRERIRKKVEMQRRALSTPKSSVLEGWQVKQVKLLQNDLFRVELSPDMPEIEIEEFIGILKEAYGEIGDDLGYFPPRIHVSMFRTPGELELEGINLSEKTTGYFDGTGIRIMLPYGRRDYGMTRVNLRHEYTHLVIYGITSDNCPRWLNEGLAEYEARELLSYEWEMLSQAVASGILPPLSKLFSQEGEKMQYLQAHAAVSRLIKNHGMLKIRKLLHKLGTGEEFNVVFEETFSMPFDEFEVAGLYLPISLR